VTLVLPAMFLLPSNLVMRARAAIFHAILKVAFSNCSTWHVRNTFRRLHLVTPFDSVILVLLPQTGNAQFSIRHLRKKKIKSLLPLLMLLQALLLLVLLLLLLLQVFVLLCSSTGLEW